MVHNVIYLEIIVDDVQLILSLFPKDTHFGDHHWCAVQHTHISYITNHRSNCHHHYRYYHGFNSSKYSLPCGFEVVLYGGWHCFEPVDEGDGLYHSLKLTKLLCDPYSIHKQMDLREEEIRLLMNHLHNITIIISLSIITMTVSVTIITTLICIHHLHHHHVRHHHQHHPSPWSPLAPSSPSSQSPSAPYGLMTRSPYLQVRFCQVHLSLVLRTLWCCMGLSTLVGVSRNVCCNLWCNFFTLWLLWL